jgi:hypothetical protein
VRKAADQTRIIAIAVNALDTDHCLEATDIFNKPTRKGFYLSDFHLNTESSFSSKLFWVLGVIQDGAKIKHVFFQIIVSLFIFNVSLLHGYGTDPSALFSGGVGR